MKKIINDWNLENNYLQDFVKKKFYPSVTMLRFLFSKNYSDNVIEHNHKKKVLDIGCLYLNNLLPFKDRNFLLYGTEINDKSIKILKKKAKLEKINVNLKLGFNSKLPFSNSFFDVLLSINTIQYGTSMSGIHKTLKEMKRVLKKSKNKTSTIYIETPAPSHYFRKKCKKLNKNIYQSTDKNEFRNQNKFVFFNSKKEIKSIFSKYFHNVEVGIVKENYSKRTVSFFMIKGSN